MKKVVKTDKEYTIWLKDLKSRVRSVQIKAMVKVNTEMLNFYWELGMDIVEKQSSTSWGDGFIKQLSSDLMKEFPSINGFSIRNIKYMRQWFLFFSKGISIGQQLVAQLENEKGLQVVSQLHDSIGQQAVALITQVPWGHNITIITKCKSIDEALFYVNSIIENGWSRSVLNHQIESDLYKRKGKSISVSEYIVTKKLPNEFKSTLPTIKEIEDELKK